MRARDLLHKSGMGRPLRYVPPGSVVEVTCRTVQGRGLLRPSREVNDLILGIMGRAQEKFPVRMHAFVVMGNHAHWLLSVDNAAQLASFMGFVCGNIAREIGRLHDWHARFWARRYRAILVVDETAAIDRLRYILRNGCKEGFVDRPADWPGVSSVRALTRGQRLSGTWVDRTAAYRSRRRGDQVNWREFSHEYEVVLTPLPCWKELSASMYRQACCDLVAAIEHETRDERARSGRRCMGAKRVLRQHPHERPLAPTRRPAPRVHASSREAEQRFLREYKAFVDAYRIAADDLRLGMAAVFPLGAFPPRLPFVAELPTLKAA